MKPFFKSCIFLLLIVIAGCNANHESGLLDVADELAPEMLAESAQSQQEMPEIERKLIKEGNIEFETDDLKRSRKVVVKAVEKYKGYVSSDQEYKYPGRISNTLEVRIPAEHFDAFLADATDGVEKFDSKNIEVKDVTEEFLDIQARVKTKKELENRYLELLKKANKVNEILEIEKQIGDLRAEIESIEGRLKYLTNKIAFSSLRISFYQTVPTESEFGGKFKDGIRNGWENLIWFFVILTNIWPFVVIAIGAFFGYKFVKKRKTK